MPLDLIKKRILVTGGTGFLGQHIMRKLNRVCLHAKGIGREFDLRNLDDTSQILSEFRPDIIIHLAATCGGIGANRAAPAQMIHDNLMMGANLVSACAATQHSIKIIAVGSVCSYPADTPVPFKESDLWNGYPEPTNAPYGIAKRVLWSLLDAYHRQYGLKCAYLIPANLYGPGDHFDLETSHVIPAMIRKFCEAEPRRAMVTLWGTGAPTRDFLYVEDCAEAIIRAAQRIDMPQPINLGTGVETSISFLAAQIGQFVGYDGPVEFDTSKPDGQQRRCLDTLRAKELLDWQANTPLSEGLRRTVEWAKNTLATTTVLR